MALVTYFPFGFGARGKILAGMVTNPLVRRGFSKRAFLNKVGLISPQCSLYFSSIWISGWASHPHGTPWVCLYKEQTKHLQPILVFNSFSLETLVFNFNAIYLSCYFRSKHASFLSDFFHLTISSWCLVKVLHFIIQSS